MRLSVERIHLYAMLKKYESRLLMETHGHTLVVLGVGQGVAHPM